MEGEEDETDEEKADKVHNKLSATADEAINRWAETAPLETQQAVVDAYAETGIIDYERAGVDQVEALVVEQAFTQRLERSILTPVGLDLDTWSEFIDQAELPAFRMAVVRGDWALLTDHAQRVAAHIAANPD
ncbi:hypothetical protein [Allomesorhizobium camelthorni]|uniref:Uncharacterized protein n=1 Tax=Allomesorhizobium camelthorni TaxID=475069 RepID=A0A6G4WKW3_9HYPH|nr:hypothetical protein [Mesorhizobium camelthorni]NGO54823.1 hypothetical protein [Mesorhizobium camelthorni]